MFSWVLFEVANCRCLWTTSMETYLASTFGKLFRISFCWAVRQANISSALESQATNAWGCVKSGLYCWFTAHAGGSIWSTKGQGPKVNRPDQWTSLGYRMYSSPILGLMYVLRAFKNTDWLWWGLDREREKQKSAETGRIIVWLTNWCSYACKHMHIHRVDLEEGWQYTTPPACFKALFIQCVHRWHVASQCAHR